MQHTAHRLIDGIRQFGSLVPTAAYVLRPGGYCVVCRTDGKIAVVETNGKFYLPGGGQNVGEAPEGAAIREAMEECGLQISIIRRLGMADELVYSPDEHTHFRKRCTFFLAELTVGEVAGGEPDHRLIWMLPDQAVPILRHESQKWAVAECAA